MGITTNKWTPISKGYPREPKWVTELTPYLVTCRGCVHPTELTYMGEGRFEDINGNSDMYDVIAWMPMPSVYKPKPRKGRR